ncbi:hypothetical protein SELR_pSRC500450 (plasmid) [Selenomonas ruminantium subsp. lactilytica TAM6421]|uniref:Uncharacterized protein n=1 Tax=Selenomonas ruminantium subsp. lactilytica (strain NBRC 103574 / TAM6421) TaxID=927704 RepID=I0GWT2_SELRL|nr:hypothetical protein [Selenomonas ruminantium]BAL85219.1 hypothetical protein SELR_pSRC500450 [Selenomonas ruminantium subsp. lactilytica TAM6421]
MKKVFVVVTLLFSLFLPLSHCSAADWCPLFSNEYSKFYVDRNTGKWDKKELRVKLKNVKADGDYELINLAVWYGSVDSIFLKNEAVAVYDKNGRYVKTTSDKDWQLVKPNTVGQFIALTLFHIYQEGFKKANNIPW